MMKMCEDCLEKQKKNGAWVCHELFDMPLEKVEECPLEITDEEMEKAKKAERVKIQHGAKDESKKRKAPERKPDEEKIFLVSEIAHQLECVLNDDFECENIQITNKTKLIEFDFGGNHYKLDLIKTRKPKK